MQRDSCVGIFIFLQHSFLFYMCSRAPRFLWNAAARLSTSSDLGKRGMAAVGTSRPFDCRLALPSGRRGQQDLAVRHGTLQHSPPPFPLLALSHSFCMPQRISCCWHSSTTFPNSNENHQNQSHDDGNDGDTNHGPTPTVADDDDDYDDDDDDDGYDGNDGDTDHGSTTSTSASTTNSTPTTGVAQLGWTENGALTYWATGSACVDLYFDVVPGISVSQLHELLLRAWDEDPHVTLQLIVQLGDPRKGKSDRDNFYQALYWLYQKTPETVVLNLRPIAELTCWKSILDLLVLVAYGPTALDDTRSQESQQRLDRQQQEHDTSTLPFLVRQFFACPDYVPLFQQGGYTIHNAFTLEPLRKTNQKYRNHNNPGKQRIIQWVDNDIRVAYKSFQTVYNRERQEVARVLRKEKHSELKRHAQSLLETDRDYQRLWNAVADLFAQELKHDKKRLDEHYQHLSNRNPNSTDASTEPLPVPWFSGLPAKWAPTIKNSHDRRTGIVNGIVERLYPPATHQWPNGTYDDYLSFARDWYRKEVSRQRGAAQIPEHYIGSGSWHLVNYQRMPSNCRYLHGHIYKKHDTQRYHEYLQVAKSEAQAVLMAQQEPQSEEEDSAPTTLSNKIKAGALLPHKIVEKALSTHNELDNDRNNEESSASSTSSQSSLDEDESNLQWLQLVQDIRNSGALPPRSMSICDVSGSMIGEPMNVAIALSLLVSDLEPLSSPWRGKIVSFSARPQLYTVDPPSLNNLATRALHIKDMDWGQNTHFQSVFNLILETAQFWNVPREEMPTTLFVFSDMEFDQARIFPHLQWETDYEQIQSKYQQAGYDREAVPHIVFWNLRPSRSKPTSSSQRGVTLLSGFGAGMLKSFLAGQWQDITPYKQMLEALRPYRDHLKLAPTVAKSSNDPAKPKSTKIDATDATTIV